MNTISESSCLNRSCKDKVSHTRQRMLNSWYSFFHHFLCPIFSSSQRCNHFVIFQVLNLAFVFHVSQLYAANTYHLACATQHTVIILQPGSFFSCSSPWHQTKSMLGKYSSIYLFHKSLMKA